MLLGYVLGIATWFVPSVLFVVALAIREIREQAAKMRTEEAEDRRLAVEEVLRWIRR